MVKFEGLSPRPQLRSTQCTVGLLSHAESVLIDEEQIRKREWETYHAQCSGVTRNVNWGASPPLPHPFFPFPSPFLRGSGV